MKKSKISVIGLLVVVMLAQLLPLGAFADGEKTETVVQSLYDDKRVGNYFACQKWHDRAGETGSVLESSTDLIFNGAASYKLSNSQGGIFYSWWKTFEEYEYTLEAVKSAITAQTAYVGGWFYADGPGRTIILIDDAVDELIVLPEKEWVFLSQKIPSTNIKQGVYDTGNTPGNIFMDDVKIVSVSDGSAPTPWERTISIPSQPNMYAKNLYTFYSDGTLNANHQHNSDDVTRYKDYANTENSPHGSGSSLKMTGELYLQPTKNGSAVTYGALSDEIKTAIEEGRAYLTFWQFINNTNLTENDPGYSADVTWDLYFPGNNRTRGQWVWVKTQITNVNTNNIYFKCKNAYAWLDDICITVFEDRDKGFLEDKYEIAVDGTAVADDVTTIESGKPVTVTGEYYNNTKKAEKRMSIAAVYSADGMLEDVMFPSEASEILPFNEGSSLFNFTVPSGSAGKTLKIMLWSDLVNLKPGRAFRAFTIQ
jgi:hypothetical protein